MAFGDRSTHQQRRSLSRTEERDGRSGWPEIAPLQLAWVRFGVRVLAKLSSVPSSSTRHLSCAPVPLSPHPRLLRTMRGDKSTLLRTEMGRNLFAPCLPSLPLDIPPPLTRKMHLRTFIKGKPGRARCGEAFYLLKIAVSEETAKNVQLATALRPRPISCPLREMSHFIFCLRVGPKLGRPGPALGYYISPTFSEMWTG